MAEVLSARLLLDRQGNDEIVANGNNAVAKLLQFFADSHDEMVIRITSVDMEKISLSRTGEKFSIHIEH